jgi:hypothetical protein
MLAGATTDPRLASARRTGAVEDHGKVNGRVIDIRIRWQVLQNAERIGCRKYLTPTAMVAGNPKLNLAFVAHLFNTHPGLEPLEETEKPVIEDFDAEGEREARVFTLWLNSLNVDPGVYNLFEDLKVS